MRTRSLGGGSNSLRAQSQLSLDSLSPALTSLWMWHWSDNNILKFKGSGRPLVPTRSNQLQQQVSKSHITCAPRPVSAGCLPSSSLPAPSPSPTSSHEDICGCHFLLRVRAPEQAHGSQTPGKALSGPPRQLQLFELPREGPFLLLSRPRVPESAVGREDGPAQPRSLLANSSVEPQQIMPIPAPWISSGASEL